MAIGDEKCGPRCAEGAGSCRMGRTNGACFAPTSPAAADADAWATYVSTLPLPRGKRKESDRVGGTWSLVSASDPCGAGVSVSAMVVPVYRKLVVQLLKLS